MTAVSRWTGLGKLISFYRHFYFNGPRVTTAAGIVLLLGIAAIRLYWLFGSFPVPAYPVYLAAYFAVLVAAAMLAAAAMVVPKRTVAMAGWALGGLVATASLAMYIVSRTAGLPGLAHLVGRWDYALGTFAMVLAAMYLALHFSLLTGMSVAYPGRRSWHD